MRPPAEYVAIARLQNFPAAHESFQFRSDHKLAIASIPSDKENVGLAADLAVFYVTLPGTSGLVHGRLVPLATARALESG